MRPRLAFAALLSTSLVAVAVPAAAGSSDSSASPPDVGTVTQQLQPGTDPSPSETPASDTGSTTAGTAQPAADPPSTATASCAPSLSLTSFFSCVSAQSGGANPLTGLITQLQGMSGASGTPGLSPAPFTALAACVQTELSKSPPDGAALEGCFSTFGKAVTGAPQATCLDTILQGTATGVENLLTKQDPSALEAELTGLQNQLTGLATCLQGTPAGDSSPSAPATTGTTTSSGGATTPTDPTEAVPVAATPTFTG